MKFQVVSIITLKFYFTGLHAECQDWLDDYGLGWSQFEIMPYNSFRDEGDISETY